MTEPTFSTLLFPGRPMSVTRTDSIEMEKPEWLTQMETVLEVLNEGVIISNDRHQILFANSRIVEMTGIPRQDLIGFDASRFYSSQEWDFLTQQIDVAVRPGHNRYAFVLPQTDGGRLPVIFSSPPFQNSGSRFGIGPFPHSPNHVRPSAALPSPTE